MRRSRSAACSHRVSTPPGQRCQALVVGLVGRLEDGVAPRLERLGLVGAQLFGLLAVGDRTPAVAGQEEVVHLGGVALGCQPVGEGTIGGWLHVALAGFGPRAVLQLAHLPGGTPGADQAVAPAQLKAQPRRLQARVHGVEPQADLGQLDGGGVEIHPVALVQREVGLHLLEFAQIPVGVERFAQLGLAALQVLGGQLVDRLVEERPGTQRRFADGEVEQLGGFLMLALPPSGA
jgi:hypothetical protein